MALTRDAFLGKREIPRKTVAIDGETMLVRGMTGRERTKWERESQKDPDGARGRLAVLGTVNEDGTPYFKDSDAKAINDLPAAFIEPLVDGIFECSGMTTAARVELGKGSATADGSETPSS